MDESTSLDLFVSHSSVDADLVAPLVDLIQNALGLHPDRIRATSVEGYRLPAGIPFEEALRRETHDARAFVAIISPASLSSTYVVFEIGSRWGAKRHLVPLLTPEVNASNLQGPLANLNALRIDSPAQMQQLIDDLAVELKVKARLRHQYDRQFGQFMDAAKRRPQSLPPKNKAALPESDGTEDSDVDYASLIEEFDILMDLPAEHPDGPEQEKAESMQDSIKNWIRKNRLQAHPEIAKDADDLLRMLREIRRARLTGASVAYREGPRDVFERLVERVRSKRRPS
jgi:hypothetical protein